MTNTSKTIVWIIVIVVLVLGAWYFISMPHTQTQAINTPVTTTNAGLNGSPNQTNTGQASVSPVVAISTTNAKLGNFLVASDGMTLYRYTPDKANVSNCNGTCSALWPAYAPVANEPLVPGNGLTGQLGTITRADGTTQLTYKGVPLYLFKNDTAPGDTKGQNIAKVWFVVKP